MSFDKDYVEELKTLETKEAKYALAEYAEEFGIKLRKNKSFDNMVQDLKEALETLAAEPMPEENEGLSIAEIIDQEGQRIDQEPQESPQEAVVEEAKETIVEQEKIVQTVKESAPALEKPSEVESTSVPATTLEKIELPKDFSPSVVLIGPTPGHANIPYWVHDFIVQNEDWKSKIDQANPRDHAILKSLLYYINRSGSVQIRESRNSRFYVLN